MSLSRKVLLGVVILLLLGGIGVAIAGDRALLFRATFIAKGTGAVERPAMDKDRDTVSALDFCNATDVNGATDNTTCLQNAINASQGKVLFIPAGVYVVTSALNLTNANAGYRIIGAPRTYSSSLGPVDGAIIKNTNVAGGHAFNISNTNSNGEVVIQGLTVRGNALSGNGFNVVNAIVEFTDVWSLYHGLHGFYLESAFSSMLRGCGAIQNQRNGLYINQKGNSITVTEGSYNGNDRANGGYADVYLTGTALLPNWGITLIGNDIEGGGVGNSTAYGLVAQFTYGLTVQGNYFEVAGTNLLYLDSTSDAFTITGNFFHDGAVSITGLNGTVSNNIVTAVGGASDHVNTTFTVDGTNGGNIRAWGNDTRMIPGTPTFTASLSFPGPPGQRREEYASSIPTAGTYATGDIVWRRSPTVNQPLGWIATSSGTLGTLNAGATTGTCTINTNALTVNSATGLSIGNIITVVGLAGTYTVTWTSGTAITVNPVCSASVAGAAVAYNTPGIAPFGTIGAGTSNVTLVSVTQANLGAPANGTLYFCSDCTTASACTAAGTGALASRQNGAWKCL